MNSEHKFHHILQAYIMSTDHFNLWIIKELRAHRHKLKALRRFNIKQHYPNNSQKKTSTISLQGPGDTQPKPQYKAHQFHLSRDFIRAFLHQMLHLRHSTNDNQDAINAIERSQSHLTIEGANRYHDTCYNNEVTVFSTFQATI